MPRLGVLSISAVLLLMQGKQPGKIGRMELSRLGELYHLTDCFGDELWPGFDVRRIPIAINNHDREELLVNHPRPGPSYEKAKGWKLEGGEVLLRKGSSRYGPKGGGWAVMLDGVKTAYVGVPRQGMATEDWLTLLLHECFHVYQSRYRQAASGPREDPPEYDPIWCAGVGLESRVLHELLKSPLSGQSEHYAKMFLAVREKRRARLTPAQRRAEDEMEWNEGTAKYVEARLMLLISEMDDFADTIAEGDPAYHGFLDAGKRYRNRYLASILPPRGQLISSMHLRYQIGMAQCLVLDRVRKNWKVEIARQGGSPRELLRKTFVPSPAEMDRLVGQARELFDYDQLLAEQKHLVDQRIAKIRSFLEGKGRRYRIHHRRVRGRMNWKPLGPVYHVPKSLLEQSGGVTIWEGGIPRLEHGDLVFESKPKSGPVIYGRDWLEWIDRDPAEDGADLTIGFDRKDGDVYVGLELESDGFRLTIPRARIHKTRDLVEVFPESGS